MDYGEMCTERDRAHYADECAQLKKHIQTLERYCEEFNQLADSVERDERPDHRRVVKITDSALRFLDKPLITETVRRLLFQPLTDVQRGQLRAISEVVGGLHAAINALKEERKDKKAYYTEYLNKDEVRNRPLVSGYKGGIFRQRIDESEFVSRRMDDEPNYDEVVHRHRRFNNQDRY